MAKQVDTDGTKKVAITVRIEPALKAELDKLIERTGDTQANTITTALEHYIDSKKLSVDKMSDYGRKTLKAIVKLATKDGGRCTPAGVAKATGFSIKTVAATVGQLMNKGLVAKEVAKPEGKGPAVNYLAPTTEGAALAAQIH